MKTDSKILMELFGGVIPSQVHENWVRATFERPLHDTRTDAEVVEEINQNNKRSLEQDYESG